MNFINNWMYRLIYLYIIILPLFSDNFKYKGMKIPQDPLLLIIILLYGFSVIANTDGTKNFLNNVKDFFHDSVSIFMFILFITMTVSVSYSLEKTLAITESIRFMSYILIYFIIKYGTQSRKVMKNIINSYIFSSIILCLLGIIQYFTGFDLNKKFVFDYKSGAKIRIAATLGNPNSYAAFLVLILFPLIMLIVGEKNRKKKILYTIISFLVFINMILTGSRNAILAFAIGCVVLAITYNWKLIFILIGASVTSLYIPQVLNRIKEISDPTQNLSRIKLWSTALKMIQEHPLIGVGNGNFISLYDAYVKKYPELKYPDYKRMPSHNSYLKIESELGVVGILSFLGVLISILSKVIKFIKVENEEYFKLFFKGFLASFISFLFMNISDNLFFVPKVTTYFWIVCAVCQNLLYNLTKNNSTIIKM